MQRPLSKRPGPGTALPRRVLRGVMVHAPRTSWARFRPGQATARVLGAAAAALMLLAGGWMWLRDSSLVAVERVSVTGASGPQGQAIRSALTDAARDMTTLDVRVSHLRSVVAPYGVVSDLRVRTEFPHGLRIEVIERPPVAALSVDGHRVPVTADGTILHGIPAAGPLAVITAKHPELGPHLRDPKARQELAALAVAPSPVRPRVARVYAGGHGLTVRMRSGLSLYLGDDGRLLAKWEAATRVIADASSAGARYVDVRVPERPVAAVSGAQALFEHAAAGVLPGGVAAAGGGPGSGSAGSRPAAGGGAGTGSGATQVGP